MGKNPYAAPYATFDAVPMPNNRMNSGKNNVIGIENRLLTMGSSSGTTTVNGHSIKAFAGVRFGPTSGWVAGTTVIKVTGTGTLDGPNFTLGYTTIPVTIAAGSGTVTISPGFRCDLGSFKYESGNVVSTGAWTGSSAGGGGGGGQRVYSSVTSR